MILKEFLSLDNVFFTVAGQGISYLEFFGVLLGLTSVFLASLARAVNYWVGFVYATVLFLMFLQKSLYTNMLLQPVSLGINVYGLYKWTRPGEGQKNSRNQLVTSFLSNKQRVYYVLLLIGFVILWGFFLTKLHVLSEKFPPARSPFLDASVAGLMLMAQILAAQKKWECWIFWILLNVGNVVMYISSGLVFMPIVAICFLLFNFVGLVHWKKEWEKHKQVC